MLRAGRHQHQRSLGRVSNARDSCKACLPSQDRADAASGAIRLEANALHHAVVCLLAYLEIAHSFELSGMPLCDISHDIKVGVAESRQILHIHTLHVQCDSACVSSKRALPPCIINKDH